MGIFKAAKGAAGGVLADQWLEYISCPALPAGLLAQKGAVPKGANSANNGTDEVITSGSKIAVADGQCAVALEMGKVLGVYDTPGEHTFQSEFSGGLLSGGGLSGVLRQTAYRVGFGGDAPISQCVMYLNMKEIPGNRFAFTRTLELTGSGGDFSMDLQVDFAGAFSFRITEPLAFYKNVCGGTQSALPVSAVLPQLTEELAGAAAAALADICMGGVSPVTLAQTAPEVCEALARRLTQQWSSLRGFAVVSVAFDTVALKAADQFDLQTLEIAKTLSDPIKAAGYLAAAQADAMRLAAANTAGTGGAALFAAPHAGKRLWRCPCGALNTGNFCESCGKQRP